jgi:uncharacterized protein YcbK (DUF882 family)
MRRLALVAVAVAGGVLTAGGPARAAGKKDLLLAASEKGARARPPDAAEKARWQRTLRARIGKKPPALINVHNLWTHEFVAVEADSRAPSPVPQTVVNRFLRCHFTNHHIDIDGRLFGVLIKAATKFRVARVDIVSGFRAPKYNLILRKKGRRVARQSEHTLGHAVDFRLPGVTTERLRNWARTLRLGGVGYYRNDKFVHVDIGPVRYWAE